MERRVFLAMLSLTGRPCLPVMESLYREMSGTKGVEVHYLSLTGDSMLPHARNLLVANFLAKGGADMVLIDDDNHPDPGWLGRLLAHDADVVGVPVRLKQEAFGWNVQWLTDRPIAADANGLVEVESVGTGIIRISRSAIERLKATVEEDWFHSDRADGGKAWPIFEYEVRDHHWHGEDVAFCRRWRALGGKVFIDPEIRTHHIGSQTWSGGVGEWLRAAPPTISITVPPITVGNGFRP